jgi:hypothetical protein
MSPYRSNPCTALTFFLLEIEYYSQMARRCQASYQTCVVDGGDSCTPDAYFGSTELDVAEVQYSTVGRALSQSRSLRLRKSRAFGFWHRRTHRIFHF